MVRSPYSSFLVLPLKDTHLWAPELTLPHAVFSLLGSGVCCQFTPPGHAEAAPSMETQGPRLLLPLGWRNFPSLHVCVLFWGWESRSSPGPFHRFQDPDTHYWQSASWPAPDYASRARQEPQAGPSVFQAPTNTLCHTPRVRSKEEKERFCPHSVLKSRPTNTCATEHQATHSMCANVRHVGQPARVFAPLLATMLWEGRKFPGHEQGHKCLSLKFSVQAP